MIGARRWNFRVASEIAEVLYIAASFADMPTLTLEQATVCQTRTLKNGPCGSQGENVGHTLLETLYVEQFLRTLRASQSFTFRG